MYRRRCVTARHGAPTSVRKCPWHSSSKAGGILARAGERNTCTHTREIYRRHAVRCNAVRCGATAPSNGAIHVVPKRPSLLRVYDPFYVHPPAALCSPHTQPLFLPIGKVNSRRVSPVIARTQIGFIHGQTLCTRIRAPALIRNCSRYRRSVHRCLRALLLLRKHDR